MQVSFEEKAPHVKGLRLGQVMIPLPKAEVGSMTFDQIRALALAKAISFLGDCIKSSGIV